MHQYSATIQWEDSEGKFQTGQYSRAHQWHFDGGIMVPASSSPLVVRLPFSRAEAVDPEEAFVASLSSCHMLWFLSITARRGFCVDRYADAAVGVMARNAQGKLAMTRVTLRPEVTFSGARVPSREEVVDLHEAAHDACFIANSVRTEVLCEPVIPEGLSP